jgi:glutathione-independent formaldehyde dehydrogenase
MATANRVIAFMGPRKVEVKSIDYPKLQNPKGKKIEHGSFSKLFRLTFAGATSISITAASRLPRE